MARFLSGLAGLAMALSLLMPSGASAQVGEPAKTAIGAATAFAVGYGVWRIEQKCMKMPAARQKPGRFGPATAFFTTL